jgi:hypothetical protein
VNVQPPQAADRKAAVAEQRKQIETSYGNLPELKAKRVQDVFTLRLEDSHLALHSPLSDGKKPLDGAMRARLEGMDGLTVVQSSRFFAQGPNGNVETRSFVLTHYDYADPEVIATLSVQSQQHYFHLDKSSQLPDGFRSVRLMAQSNGPGQPNTVNFMVSETNNVGAVLVSLNFQAPDFTSLLRNHPKETNEYLRPLLRTLGQEQVFAPDALVAWQVFADRWRPDARTAQQVGRILPQLDADDYESRDAAVKALEKMGRPAAAVLLRADRDALSAEQNTRVDQVLAPYTQLSPDDAQRLRSDAGFLLDCLYLDDAEVRDAALARLAEVTGKPVEFDGKADRPTRWAAVAGLRRELLSAKKDEPAKS